MRGELGFGAESEMMSPPQGGRTLHGCAMARVTLPQHWELFPLHRLILEKPSLTSSLLLPELQNKSLFFPELLLPRPRSWLRGTRKGLKVAAHPDGGAVASWCPSHPVQMMDRNQFAVIFILFHVTRVAFRNNQRSSRPCQFQRRMDRLMAIS